jgi:tRNA (pseudouridine54-N1)-methyltransferase
MRRFVVLGQKALASDDFRLDDLPGTSGRLDVLLRCVRAAILYSHGSRRDVIVYLLLGAGPRAPRVLRLTAADARFLRPDERSLAVLAQKALASHADDTAIGFVDIKPGIALSRGGLAEVLADLGAAALYVLEEGGQDVRAAEGLGGADIAFFLGDPGGFDEAARRALTDAGARPISVGPVSLHAEDALAVVSNELDRRSAP